MVLYTFLKESLHNQNKRTNRLIQSQKGGQQIDYPYGLFQIQPFLQGSPENLTAPGEQKQFIRAN